ncbi:MAG: hypothetical protein DMF74_11105, partial [Acidobacteria bacterium]
GNLIGTNATGTAALSNSGDGIRIDHGELLAQIIGGNVISGNGQVGIQIVNGSLADVQGNFVGTDRTGNFAIANQVGIKSESYIKIIGNVVSGNSSDGIELG